MEYPSYLKVLSDVHQFCKTTRDGLLASPIKLKGEEEMTSSIPQKTPAIKKVGNINVVNERIYQVLSKSSEGVTSEKLTEILKKFSLKISQEELERIDDSRFFVINHRFFTKEVSRNIYVRCHLGFGQIKKIAPEAEEVGGGIYLIPFNDLLKVYKVFQDGDLILDEYLGKVFKSLWTPKDKAMEGAISELMSL